MPSALDGYPISMAIQIDDYKIARSTGNVHGLIPLESMAQQANIQARAVGSVVSAVDGVSGFSDRLNELVRVGDASKLKRGVEQAYLSAKEDFSKREDYDFFEKEWSPVFLQKVRQYLPEKPSGISKENEDRLIAEYEERGLLEVRAMSQLGMVNKSKSLWRQSVRMAVDKGDIDAVEREIDNGAGFFLTEDNGSDVKEKARRAAMERKYLQEARRNPLEMVRAIEDGEHPILGDEELEYKIIPELRQWHGRLKEDYGRALLSSMEVDGKLDEASLKSGLESNMLTREQVERYRAGMSMDREYLLKGGERKVPVVSVCEWIRRVDEVQNSREGLGELYADLACSGLPPREIVKLAERLKENGNIPYEARAHLSRELAELYYEGVWGTPSEDRSSREWNKSQHEVFEFLSNKDKKSVQNAFNLIESKKKYIEHSWVCFDAAKIAGQLNK